ncbi:MAG TPA: hypothetical protein VHD56_05045 [Tepidisphaeraceae bacterium]|nr:hypothetical protein [Tepidisphaeraceae bacterium]
MNVSSVSQYSPTLAKATPRRMIDLKTLQPEATFLRILGVNYVHVKTADGGDLYLTEYGVPFIRHLDPRNWYEDPWFAANRQQLPGTSTVYRVPTKPIDQHRIKSIDLVVKWSRVGQDVVLDTFTLQRNINAEFNTPFEEFARVEELRLGEQGPSDIRILTQKPLAIYVPPEQMQPWQTGRSKQRLLAKKARHPGVEIDVLRSYIMLFGWIDGINAVEAFQRCIYDTEEQKKQLEQLTVRIDKELADKGFVVADHKPTHLILRMSDDYQVLRRRDGRIVYALVDYELLSRTDAYEDKVRAAKRREYLVRQRDRFAHRSADQYPDQVKPARILDVDYVFGRAESTSGTLWVVGNDPELFAYFLPERWRNSQQVRLSGKSRTYYAQTKDRIHLVWKVSRVGEVPPGDLGDPEYKKLLLQGFNSPFEEVSLAIKLAQKGGNTVYPRAIYMTASPGNVSGVVQDARRFERMCNIHSPMKLPIMPIDHDYITIWGYWRGLDDLAAVDDTMLWIPIDIDGATKNGLIDERTALKIMQRHAARLAGIGFCDTLLTPDHVLISYVPAGSIKTTPDGQIETRQCNFEMVREM